MKNTPLAVGSKNAPHKEGRYKREQAMIGILALQGGFEAHALHLTALHQPWCYVRTPEEIAQVQGLILPGGESTTLLRLMTPALKTALQAHHHQQKPIFATCAGVILLAQTVQPAQDSLGFLAITVARNAYGRQLESFSTTAAIKLGDEAINIPMVFIRAPKIIDFHGDVNILAKQGQDVVCVEQQHLIAATFHPELTDDHRLHAYFINKVNHATD